MQRRTVLASAATFTSVTTAWWRPVRAQERVARVGYLSWQDSGAIYETTLQGFVDGLREEGFVQGKNVELLRRSAGSDAARFKPLARELA